MPVGTVLAVFLVPIFFVVVRSLFKDSERQRERFKHHAEEAGITAEAGAAFLAQAEEGLSEAEKRALHQGQHPAINHKEH